MCQPCNCRYFWSPRVPQLRVTYKAFNYLPPNNHLLGKILKKIKGQNWTCPWKIFTVTSKVREALRYGCPRKFFRNCLEICGKNSLSIYFLTGAEVFGSINPWPLAKWWKRLNRDVTKQREGYQFRTPASLEDKKPKRQFTEMLRKFSEQNDISDGFVLGGKVIFDITEDDKKHLRSGTTFTWLCTRLCIAW